MSSAVGIEVMTTPLPVVEYKDAQRVADALAKVLADTFILSLKTQNFHWNVTGPMFQTLHLMFEEQYKELWSAVDPIAERMRSLGFIAPGSYREFSKLSISTSRMVQ
jgi:starvation-inducible DNA-binding protein